MTKNLRGEIHSTAWEEVAKYVQANPNFSGYGELVDNLTNRHLDLFRSWALGCVGEDVDIPDDLSTYSKGSLLGNNQAKQRIRKKIEMDTSK